MRVGPIVVVVALASCGRLGFTVERGGDGGSDPCTTASCTSTATTCATARSCDPEGAPGNCDRPGVPQHEGASCADCGYDGFCDRCTAGTCATLPACDTKLVDETAARGLSTSSPSNGVAWLDVDGDGDQDLFVRSVGLYINDGTGHFTEQSGPRGLAALGVSSYPIAVGDYDSDGDVDLFVGDDTRFGTIPNHFYRNDGTGHFTDVAAAAGLQLAMNTPRAAVFVDHDADGDLDLLYATEFNAATMYRNDGALPFADDSARFSPTSLQGDCASWADYDRDGHQDLFIATGSTGTPNHLFHGTGSAWTDVAAAAGVADVASASTRWGGATWNDIDGDGNLDLYVVDNSGPDKLYMNHGDGTFSEIDGTVVGLGDGGNIATAAAWADWDRDGILDVVVPEVGLYRATGTGTFTARPDLSPGVIAAWGDFDGDGRIDLYVAGVGAAGHLYHAADVGVGCAPPRAMLVRALTDPDGDATDANTADDRDAIGARIDVDLDGTGKFTHVQTYLVGGAQGGNYGQGQLAPLVGCGTRATIDLRVRFVDGSVVTLLDTPVTKSLVVRDPP